jgi:hypothetical protein
LEQRAASSGEGGVPLRGLVPASRLYGDQSERTESGGGAVLQQARYGGAVDKGRQAGGRSLTSLQQQLVKAGGRLIKVPIVFRNRARLVSKALGDFAQFRHDAEADGL